MWNWLVTALALGATVVLYDGSPFKPTPNALWDLVDEVGITILGTGAKWLSALEDRSIRPSMIVVSRLCMYMYVVQTVNALTYFRVFPRGRRTALLAREEYWCALV